MLNAELPACIPHTAFRILSFIHFSPNKLKKPSSIRVIDLTAMEHAMKAGFLGRSATRNGLEAFLSAHRAFAFHLALQIVGNRDQAEDVAQEALIRAASNLQFPQNIENERAWLRQIVVRRALTHLKKRKDLFPDHDFGVQSDPTNDMAVRQTLDRLQPEQRVILALAIGEQLSYQEIADSLEIPIGTVGSRIHGAKSAFRNLWECS